MAISGGRRDRLTNLTSHIEDMSPILRLRNMTALDAQGCARCTFCRCDLALARPSNSGGQLPDVKTASSLLLSGIGTRPGSRLSWRPLRPNAKRAPAYVAEARRAKAGGYVELIVQPTDGITRLLETISQAQKSIDVMIFRFDLKPMEKELEAARARGVVVRVLIAHESSQGDKRLRQLELRMLEKGILVARTGNGFARYHGKMTIVDREELHVYGFNFTALDLKSRSFGIVTRDRKAVTEAIRLFEADTLRQEYEPQEDGAFVVSPENAREILATFIKRARKQLLIYDPKVADLQMIRLISQRIKAGLDVRILGKVSKRANGGMRVQKLPTPRLHVRAMVRDGDTAFVGSQSLRAMELDARREVGLIVKEPKTVKRLLDTFEADWAKTDLGAKEAKEAKAKEAKEAKKEEKEKKEEELAEVSAR
jgi:cardiolipin synthase